MRGQSPPCSGDSAASMGPSSLTMHLPRGVGRFAGEERTLAGGAFAPAGQPFRLDFGEHDSPVAGDAKAGFKRAHQGHMQFAQDDCINSHKFPRLELEVASARRGDPVRRLRFLPHPGKSQVQPIPGKMPVETSVDSPTEQREPCSRLASVGLPLVDGGRNQNAFFDRVCGCRVAEQELPSLSGNPAPTPPKGGPWGAHPAVEMRIHHRNSRDSRVATAPSLWILRKAFLISSGSKVHSMCRMPRESASRRCSHLSCAPRPRLRWDSRTASMWECR